MITTIPQFQFIIKSYSNRVSISTHNYDNTDTNSSSPKGSSKRIKICRANQIVPWLILFLNHYPICFSPPLEGLGEVLEELEHLFVNNFPYPEIQYMVFWLWKDALSACKRCPFLVLLTPFWGPVKHLLQCDFVSCWQQDDCSGSKNTRF